MEDDMILTRPSDRRLLGDNSDIPPGPPGAENDTFDLVKNRSSPVKKDDKRRRSPLSSRRSPSPPSRSRRSPSPRGRRSSSRGRNSSRSTNRETPGYGRDYSSPRHYGSNRIRRSRERKRSPDRKRNRSRERLDRRRRERSRSRDRYRGRRSRSRSASPRGRRWSPIAKKPASPPPPPPPMNDPTAYAAPPVYGDAYAAYPAQYPQQYTGADYTTAPPPPAFTAAYPPPPTWGLPIPPGDDFSTATAWTAAPVPPPQQTAEPDEDQLKRDAAVAQEVRNQREELKKQRNDYLKRAATLKREMKILKEQRNDLISGDAPPSPTTKGFLEENDRLQSQIQKKLNTIENVIDMLSGIIGEEKPPTPVSSPKKSRKKRSDSDDSSPERLKTRLIESMKTKREAIKKESDRSPAKMEIRVKEEHIKRSEDTSSHKKINFGFYDPEMHWCQVCDVFPKTAKDYLNHLHSKEHASNVQNTETPWHDHIVHDEFPNYPNVPTKRTPIRGLQFFVPSTSWYCKLCNFWMGDLHCASAHLKSQKHSDKYNAYIEQNPHFEVDWMAGRQKVLDAQRAPPPPQITSVSTTGIDLLESIPLQINTQKNTDIEKNVKKRKKKVEEKKDKKKKKRSKKRKKSSSSSSSSSSESSSESESDDKKLKVDDRPNSIRVAMRNLSKTQDDKINNVESRGKWTTIQEGQPIPEPVPPPPPTIIQPDLEDKKKDEIMISQWNTPQPIISESEKKLLEELKGKLKNKPAEEEKRKKDVHSSDGTTKNVTKPIKKLEKESPKEKSVKSSRDKRSSSTHKKSVSSSPAAERNLVRRSRSRKRSKSRDGVSKSRYKRSRSRGVKRSRSRDKRSKSRGRRSRSRGRTSRDRRSRSRDRRSRSRNRRSRSRVRRRRSRSYGRRRSFSRSRSRSSSHRIEKPIVRYPEFRPRVPENKKVQKVKSEDESERKKSPATKKVQQPPPTGKKLPFIGRMPVYKKQNQGGDEKKDGENFDQAQMDAMHMGYEHYDGMAMMIDYDDLMPDPMQYVTLMGAPPPPPSVPPPQYNDDKDILPPGIDETEADLVPKPISDAPIPRKGPLPKDFQEALNIIFPGDEKKSEDIVEETKEKTSVPIANNQGITKQDDLEKTYGEITEITVPQVEEDDTSQLSLGEAFIGFPSSSFSDHSQDVPDIALVAAIPPPPPPPPPPEEEKGDDKKENNIDQDEDDNNKNESSPTESEKIRRQEELDDLALLGIDADDLAAQCM